MGGYNDAVSRMVFFEMSMKVLEEHPWLYHYTTWGGLTGILKNRCFWATHHRFLNDYSETLLFKPRLVEFVRPIIQSEVEKFISAHSQPQQRQIMADINAKGGLNDFLDHMAKVLVQSLYQPLEEISDGFYLTSFCGGAKDSYVNENGMLSQWRGYGQDGGFALVLKTEKLEEMMALEHNAFDYVRVDMDTVIYSDDEKKWDTELSPQLEVMRPYCTQLIKSYLSNSDGTAIPDAGKAYPAFVKCITRYKHRGFREENEVRIIAQPARHSKEYLEQFKKEGANPRPDKERKFRDRNGETIPFIELFSSLDRDLPIEKIIVGPHKHRETRAAALKTMLRETSIDVVISDIPFIGC